MSNISGGLSERDIAIMTLTAKAIGAQVTEDIKGPLATACKKWANAGLRCGLATAEEVRKNATETMKEEAYANTLQALKDYRKFKLAVDVADGDVSSAIEAYEEEGVYKDLLSQREKEEANLTGRIKSAARTKSLVESIERSICALDAYAETRDESYRKSVEIMKLLYIVPIPSGGHALANDEIAERMGISAPACTKRCQFAVRELSQILYGPLYMEGVI